MRTNTPILNPARYKDKNILSLLSTEQQAELLREISDAAAVSVEEMRGNLGCLRGMSLFYEGLVERMNARRALGPELVERIWSPVEDTWRNS